MSGEKTEKPTAKKRKESRKEGQVARTQELGAWSAMMLAALTMPMMVGHELGALREIVLASLRGTEDPTVATATRLLREGALHAFVAVLVLSCGIALVSVAGTVAQGGFYLATKAVKPTFSKLNPISGAKRIFGPQALWEGTKMLIKCSVVAAFVWTAIRAMMPLLGGMVPIDTVLAAVSDHALGLLRSVAVAGLVMAAADYAYQRHRTGKQTRMSKDDIKQEHKQTEGDPLVKSAIRSRQLATARNRMMADVPTADVVLVNPTHVAVALRYQAERGAPVVVARGAGAIAAAIRERAVEHEVPLVRDVPLARALYSSTEVGREIPAELFAAVAQVLAFVISRRGSGRRGGQHVSPRTEADLPPVPVAGRRRRGAGMDTSAQAPV
ncbi:EscU/YscU/HrcU family type III secretion system export apparatus switch protein [Nocardioides dongkuii]|uniref:EscU/YscU/HrcU family type III secretion system export apparatus switch protein n=1 Tax=Nocardioides dongkuii TaxID=2760089 RepID=UPI001878A7E9|nr:EscU/YscU/HrcU family type III secretion system export apparatus switch protein [Nocardioides dongkuii]